MRNIDAIARSETGTGDNLNDKMKDSVKQIKVLALLPIFPVSHSRLSIQNTHSDLGNRHQNIDGLMDFRGYST